METILFSIFFSVVLAICAALFFAARWVYIHYFKKETDMETQNPNEESAMETPRKNITQTLAFKGGTIVFLILILLIPGTMIQNLIRERQERSRETIQRINDKWSRSQTLCAPLLLVPYTTTRLDKDKKPYLEENTLYITPKELDVSATLTPEERHYGIYKAILYKSDIRFSGKFLELAGMSIDNSEFHFDKARIAIGITDLRGVTHNPEFKIGGKALEMTVGELTLFSVFENNGANNASRDSWYRTGDGVSGKTLVVNLKDINFSDSLRFECVMRLNGSSAIRFIPIGQHTAVTVEGLWPSPSFIGGFSPESTVDGKRFSAAWNILSFNRDIPEVWSNKNSADLGDNFFGVNLIETVDRYQQNMRSAKYALMFIALTFIVFFFVEIFTKKQIQFFQYVLVGIALILFYSLLLSLSEQIGFGWAYLAASAATVIMITVYFYSLIKQKPATLLLAGIMLMLYAFLYVILQTEDFTLLFGSVFLFVVLGVIMYVSNKIKPGAQSAGNEKKLNR